MKIQASSRRLSYFSCLPNRHMSSFMSILGQGIDYSSHSQFTLSKYTHSISSHTCIQQSFVFTMHIYIYIYIYNQKERERNKSFFFCFPVCFVPSSNPHHRYGFSCSQPFSLHRECWTNPSRSWHLVTLIYFRPLNHGASPHGLSQVLGPSQSY